jgi:hypothetical protein
MKNLTAESNLPWHESGKELGAVIANDLSLASIHWKNSACGRVANVPEAITASSLLAQLNVHAPGG